MSAHTPGPWSYRRVGAPTRRFEVEIPDDEPLIVGCHGGPDEVHARDEANARLIAAAPELLEALREIAAGRLDHEHDADAFHDRVRAVARAAIAKAKGDGR